MKGAIKNRENHNESLRSVDSNESPPTRKTQSQLSKCFRPWKVKGYQVIYPHPIALLLSQGYPWKFISRVSLTRKAEFKRHTKYSNYRTRKRRGSSDRTLGFREFRKFKEASTCSQQYAIFSLFALQTSTNVLTSHFLPQKFLVVNLAIELNCFPLQFDFENVHFHPLLIRNFSD